MLEVVDVVVNFGGVRALDHLSLAYEDSGVCGVIGPNGAGKTTLFDVVTGLRRPTSGTVHFNGHALTDRSVVWRARQGIRRTFQRTQLVSELSVADNVLVGIDAAGARAGLLKDLFGQPARRAAERANRRRVMHTLERCGIAELASVKAARLSVGHSRIVELARALVAEPALLLLDEPTSGLNDTETAGFGGILRSLVHDDRLQVLLVEHDVAFVMQLCHRVVVMEQGRIIADGDPAAVQADAAVQKAYLA